MEGLPNNLIGHMRAVVVAGVDVVHAGGNRFSQNGDRGIHVPRRSEGLGAGKLHGAVAHAVDICGSAGKLESAAKLRRVRHRIASFRLEAGMSLKWIFPKREFFKGWFDYGFFCFACLT